MSEMNRRDFMKLAGAGSAVIAIAGAGVVAKGRILGDHGAASSASAPITFRATAGLPQRPYPAYASLLFEGTVDPSSGTGEISRSVVAGAPDAMSSIVFPGTERSYRVTSMKRQGDVLLTRARVEDAGSVAQGESLTILVRIDTRTGDVQAPFVDRELKLVSAN